MHTLFGHTNLCMAAAYADENERNVPSYRRFELDLFLMGTPSSLLVHSAGMASPRPLCITKANIADGGHGER
jgi:hypothetical protein